MSETKYFTPSTILFSILSIFAIISGNSIFMGVLLYIVICIIVSKYYNGGIGLFISSILFLWIPIIFFLILFPVSIIVAVLFFLQHKGIIK